MALSREAQRRLATFVPPVLVALVALPFVLRQNSWWEWTTALWLLERQADHVSAHGVPTLFVHTSAGSFYPLYVYYAGFTLSVLTYPAALLGAWPVFAATCVAAPVAGYLGIWWTARNLGLSHRLAVLPGLAFAATPYLVTDLYGRGSWAELVATNAVPVMLGGLTALLWHPERGRGAALTALAGSAAIIAGTHNLTLLLAAMILPLVVLALLPLVPRGVGGLRVIAGQLGLGVLAIALGAGVTGAWLLPNLWFGPQTWAASKQFNTTFLDSSAILNKTSSVLSPTPHAPDGTWFFAQPPVLPMAWAVLALVVAAVLLRRRGARMAGSAGALIALRTVRVVLIVHLPWWHHFPSVLQSLQTPVRLLPSVAIVGAAGIIVALVTLPAGRLRAVLTGVLVVAVGAQIYLCARIAVDTQPWAPVATAALRHGDVTASSEPPAFVDPTVFAPIQFRVAKGHPLADPAVGATVSLADMVTSDAAVLSGTGHVGDRFLTSVVWSRFLRVAGDVRIAGRTAKGDVVVRVVRTRPNGSWRADVGGICSGLCLSQFKASGTWQLPAGRLLTLLSALALAAAVALGVRRRRGVAEPAAGEPVALADAGQPAVLAAGRR
jgi:hypothetical protein